jgi:hypothetical protein
MARLRAIQDPETEAINQYYRRTGQLPRVLGQTPLPGATTWSGIAGTRFTPINRPGANVNAAGTSFTAINRPGASTAGGARQGDENLPPGISINRAEPGGTAPGANPRGRGPLPARGPRGRLPAPTPMGLPAGAILRQPGPEPKRNLRRYGAFIESSPEPVPELRRNVPPPSSFDLAARAEMEGDRPGWLKIPIIYKGTLPDGLYDGFDASTGYNPIPADWDGTEEEEKRWKKDREGSLRGVDFGTWNSSWLMRMAQLKGVGMAGVEGGEAHVRDELMRMLNNVKKTEAVAAKKAAEEKKDGEQWARFEGGEVEARTFIWVRDDKDGLDVIKEKVVAALRQVAELSMLKMEAKDVSLWLSPVMWGGRPARLTRWAGRNAEVDDGYWFGLYVYKLTELSERDEKMMNEMYLREMREVALESVL